MTLRGFLTWYLGAIVFVGTAGASGYQLLSRHQAATHEAAVQAPDIVAAPTATAAESPVVTTPPGAAPSTPYNIADATKPPQPEVAAKTATVHAPKWVKPVERRPAMAARRPVAPPRPVSPPAPAQSGWVYAQVPAPAGTYYAYPGYPGYRPGYVYYPPRYQYYRVY